MIETQIAWHAEQYGEKILRQKLNNRRISTLCRVSIEDAPKIREYAKRIAAGEKVESGAGDTSAAYDTDSQYVYNAQTDTYVFNLSGVATPTVLPGQKIRDLVQAYASYDGSPATLNQCARTFKMSRAVVRKILSAMNVTHDSLPFTGEYIASATDDQLSEDAFQMRQAAIMHRIEREKWKDIQRNSDKWVSFEEHVLRAVVAAVEDRPDVPARVTQYEVRTSDEPFVAIIGLSDLHYGKYSDALENGAAADRNITEKELTECTLDLLGKISKMGRPEKIIVPIGSDFLHIDNGAGTSARGTLMDSDGTYAEILAGGLDLMEDHIEMLRGLAPVECILMSGNHDRDSGIALILALEGIYRGVDDVNVRRSYKPREYVEWGNNLIGFVHGDGVAKTAKLAGLMAREEATLWGKCQHKTIYTGHLHFEKTETSTELGVVRRQLPSLSGPDRWHNLKGFIDADKALPAYLHGAESGLMSIMYAYPTK